MEAKKMRNRESFLNFLKERRDNYVYLFTLLDIRQKRPAQKTHFLVSPTPLSYNKKATLSSGFFVYWSDSRIILLYSIHCAYRFATAILPSRLRLQSDHFFASPSPISITKKSRHKGDLFCYWSGQWAPSHFSFISLFLRKARFFKIKIFAFL